VLVRGKEDAVAVPALIREVGEAADGQEIGRLEQREAVLATQPFTALDFCRDRP
jgi:hypothetical protein